METNPLTKEDIKEIGLIVREIAADNMLPGSTDVEVEFTTQDCDPLVSGMTSYGSANGASSADDTSLQQLNLDYHVPGGQENGAPVDAYGAEVTYLPLAKLDDNAVDIAGKQEGDTKRVPIVDINAAQVAD